MNDPGMVGISRSNEGVVTSAQIPQTRTDVSITDKAA